MDNEYDIKIEEDVFSESEETAMYKFVETEKNKMIEILKKQIDGWKISLDKLKKEKNNKCIIIYQSFVMLELYVKTRFFSYKNICSYSQEINLPSFTKPSKIKHKIDVFVDEILHSDQIIEQEKEYYRKVKEEIRILKQFTNLEQIEHYTDLRYNLNINGEIIDDDISVTDELIEEVKEVISIANL